MPYSTKRGKRSGVKRNGRQKQNRSSRLNNKNWGGRLLQKARFAPVLLKPDEVSTLQQTVGNRTVQRMLAGGVVQRAPGLPNKSEFSHLAGGKSFSVKKGESRPAYSKLLDALDDYRALNDNDYDAQLDLLINIQGYITEWLESPTRQKKHKKKKAERERNRREQMEILAQLVAHRYNQVAQAREEARQLQKQQTINQNVTDAFSLLEDIQLPGSIKSKFTSSLKTTGQKIGAYQEEHGGTKEEATAGYFSQEGTAHEKAPYEFMKQHENAPEALMGNQQALGTGMQVAFESQLTSALGTQAGQENVAFGFRGNTLASSLMSAYAFKVGKTYLQQTVLPALTGVFNLEESLEVDRFRGVEEEDLPSHIQGVKNLYAELMGAFTGEGAVGRVPNEIKKTAYYIYTKALTESGQEKGAFDLTASFLFLRFINPLLTALASKFQSHPQRVLMLLSKILQNQANQVRFGEKEPYMIPFNDLLEQYEDAMTEFIIGVIDAGQSL